MSDRESLTRYRDYQRLIGEKLRSGTEDGLSRIREALGMAGDMERIAGELSRICEEQIEQIEALEREKTNLSRQLEERERRLDELKEYPHLALNAARVVTLLDENQRRSKELDAREGKLREEESAFEGEKVQLKKELAHSSELEEQRHRERDQAVREKNRALVEKEKAEKERDDALTRMRNAKDAQKAAEEAQKTAEKKAEKVRNDALTMMRDAEEAWKKDRDWYKDYAAAQDEKIKAYFRGNKEPLRNHYDDYLINPEKAEERQKYFPESVISNSGRTNGKTAADSGMSGPPALLTRQLEPSGSEAKSQETAVPSDDVPQTEYDNPYKPRKPREV